MGEVPESPGEWRVGIDGGPAMAVYSSVVAYLLVISKSFINKPRVVC